MKLSSLINGEKEGKNMTHNKNAYLVLPLHQGKGRRCRMGERNATTPCKGNEAVSTLFFEDRDRSYGL